MISGPSFWGLINPDWSLCNGGMRQSPVNIKFQFHQPLFKAGVNNLFLVTYLFLEKFNFSACLLKFFTYPLGVRVTQVGNRLKSQTVLYFERNVHFLETIKLSWSNSITTFGFVKLTSGLKMSSSTRGLKTYSQEMQRYYKFACRLIGSRKDNRISRFKQL